MRDNIVAAQHESFGSLVRESTDIVCCEQLTRHEGEVDS